MSFDSLVDRVSSPALVEKAVDDLIIGKVGKQKENWGSEVALFVIQVKEGSRCSTGLYFRVCLPVLLGKLPMTPWLLRWLHKKITAALWVSHFFVHVKEKACFSKRPLVRTYSPVFAEEGSDDVRLSKLAGPENNWGV